MTLREEIQDLLHRIDRLEYQVACTHFWFEPKIPGAMRCCKLCGALSHEDQVRSYAAINTCSVCGVENLAHYPGCSGERQGGAVR